jgi:hypothetical protein
VEVIYSELYLLIAKQFRSAIGFIRDSVLNSDPAIISLFEDKFNALGWSDEQWCEKYNDIDFSDNTIFDDADDKIDLFSVNEIQCLRDSGVNIKNNSDASVMFYFWLQSAAHAIDIPCSYSFKLNPNPSAFDTFSMLLSNKQKSILMDVVFEVNANQISFSLIAEDYQIEHKQIGAVVPNFDNKIQELMSCFTGVKLTSNGHADGLSRTAKNAAMPLWSNSFDDCLAAQLNKERLLATKAADAADNQRRVNKTLH